MKTNIYVTLTLVCALLSLSPSFSSSHAAPAGGAVKMGVSNGHDLDALWAQAQRRFDLSRSDAILLLESRRETILEDGGLRTIVHRVVWIGSPPAVRDHADLRIPWNSDNSKFEVLKLRTWRGGRWWPHESQISPTAVVETLPPAVAAAGDYTGMRETMLLHDGVELPCILETAYAIEKRSAAAGHDGLFVMQRKDPVVLVELAVSAPEGIDLKLKGYNGAPVPAGAGGDGGSEHIVTMEELGRLGSPRIAEPAVYAPCVAWSTWPDWRSLGDHILKTFSEAAEIGGAAADTFASRIGGEFSNAAKARKTASLIGELTRSIHYGSRFWTAPRPASRTLETGYGHALDRAALAAAVFPIAGPEATPVFVSSGLGEAGAELPGLSRFGEMRICVHGPDFRARYNPADGTLREGIDDIYGRTIWRPALDDSPWRYPGEQEDASSFTLKLDLEPAGEEGWSGTGYIDASGALCPYSAMTGSGGEARAHLGNVAGSVLPGAEVKEYNPSVFEVANVSAFFGFMLKEIKADDYGRKCIAIGNPSGGIADALPPDVHAYDEGRTSPVVLPCGMAEKVVLRIKMEEDEVIHLPGEISVTNGAGHFSTSIERKGDWVTIEWTLSLNNSLTQPETWPDLRSLLLEHGDPANRTVLMK